MKEKPEYENYPVSLEEMGKRYKNWTDTLALQMVLLYRVGKEVGGQKFVDRLKEEYYKNGGKAATFWMDQTGSRPEDFKDCMGIAKLQDAIDDAHANFWDGYIERTPKAFEKEVKTCPVARAWSKEPEICEVLIGEFVKGLATALNPKFKNEGFSKLLTKGDKTCRFRFEMLDEV